MQNETWGIYKPEVQRDITSNLFEKYEKKQKSANSPESEIRDLIVKLTGKSFKQIAGYTKGWTHQEMFEIYQKAIKFTNNPPALFWVLGRTHKLKIKAQLNVKENDRV